MPSSLLGPFILFIILYIIYSSPQTFKIPRMIFDFCIDRAGGKGIWHNVYGHYVYWISRRAIPFKTSYQVSMYGDQKFIYMQDYHTLVTGLIHSLIDLRCALRRVPYPPGFP